ncbi:unnamed protein product [Callosobruchus maculatus]|uniref:Peptidase S1 domain-containing protein n=1 Tax=Callosobruchus maculatus TaxID=64391 RepID=A0A653DGG6_CALMS|nr:unnamed protein product [Callosobruchus maculatus]
MKYFMVFLCAFGGTAVLGQDEVILTTIEEHPWQVSLETHGVHHCGGALISLEWVVTSASCLANVADRVTVRAGVTFLGHGGQTRRVAFAKIPHGYKLGSLKSNIAVLRVDYPFFGTDQVWPVPLPEPEPDGEYPGRFIFEISTTGWHFEEAKTKAHGQLMEIQPVVRSHYVCNQIYRKPIPSSVFCAGEHYGNLCRRDLGNPATNDNRLVGVLIWGCDADSSHPPLYSSVPHYVNWISNVTGIDYQPE